MYAGWYGTAHLPGRNEPTVRVVFPLPNGNCTALLEPRNGADGSLILASPIDRFGAPGAYLAVRSGRRGVIARRIPVAEEFRVYVDELDTLRADHVLRLWSLTALRLHYRIARATQNPLHN